MTFLYHHTTINYHISGSGPALVLLHGFLENIFMWNDVESYFSKSHSVICIDLLGHGGSGCLSDVHSMEIQAQMIASLLKSLNINSATFVGHSMGGYIALALAEQHPDFFEGLCLLNSTFEADSEERKLARAQSVALASKNYSKIVTQSYESLFALNSPLHGSLALMEGLNYALQTDFEGFKAAQYGMASRANRFEIFKQLPSKKMMIFGKADKLIPFQILQNKLSSTDISTKVIFGGHMSHLENFDELLESLKIFIAS